FAAESAAPPPHDIDGAPGEQAHVAFLQEDRRQDDQPLEHELRVAVDVVELQNVAEKTEDEDADERADHAALAAHQVRAADDDGGNRIELEAEAGVRLALPILGDVEHP